MIMEIVPSVSDGKERNKMSNTKRPICVEPNCTNKAMRRGHKLYSDRCHLHQRHYFAQEENTIQVRDHKVVIENAKVDTDSDDTGVEQEEK